MCGAEPFERQQLGISGVEGVKPAEGSGERCSSPSDRKRIWCTLEVLERNHFEYSEMHVLSYVE